ncbi:MAG: hypothetical protein HKN82_20295 [Akkermansiaceae bacterium]|nr:hypothetical protein [Akkermansiaceae bacterium]
MTNAPPMEFFEKVWRASFLRARRPVEGVLLDESAARDITEDVFDRLLSRFPRKPPESEFTSEALELAADEARARVAAARRDAKDPQRHHDPSDRRYDRNLDLDLLQDHDGKHGFREPEWTKLDPLLRPFGFQVLARKGIKSHNAEDVFVDTFAELARPKSSGKQAPIETIRVFEEIIPLFTRMLQFRAIDWRRRQSTLKNQPNVQHSYEELTEAEDHAMQFEDPGAGPAATVGDLTFDEIYKQCEECLDEFEWELVFTIYVAQTATMGEIIDDPAVLPKLGLTPKDSTSKRRRVLNDHLEPALQKLAKCLKS